MATKSSICVLSVLMLQSIQGPMSYKLSSSEESVKMINPFYDESPSIYH